MLGLQSRELNGSLCADCSSRYSLRDTNYANVHFLVFSRREKRLAGGGREGWKSSMFADSLEGREEGEIALPAAICGDRSILDSCVAAIVSVGKSRRLCLAPVRSNPAQTAHRARACPPYKLRAYKCAPLDDERLIVCALRFERSASSSRLENDARLRDQLAGNAGLCAD